MNIQNLLSELSYQYEYHIESYMYYSKDYFAEADKEKSKQLLKLMSMKMHVITALEKIMSESGIPYVNFQDTEYRDGSDE